MRTLGVSLTDNDRKKPSPKTVKSLSDAIDVFVRESTDDITNAVDTFLSVNATKIMPHFYSNVFTKWHTEQQNAWTKAILENKRLGGNAAGWGSVRVNGMLVGKLSCGLPAQDLTPELYWFATHSCPSKDKSLFLAIREQGANILTLFDLDVSGWGNEKKHLANLYGMMMEGCQDSELLNAYQRFISTVGVDLSYTAGAKDETATNTADSTPKQSVQKAKTASTTSASGKSATDIQPSKQKEHSNPLSPTSKRKTDKDDDAPMKPHEAEKCAASLAKWVADTNAAMLNVRENESALRHDIEVAKKQNELLTKQLDDSVTEYNKLEAELDRRRERIVELEKEKAALQREVETKISEAGSLQRMAAINTRQAVNSLKMDITKILKASTQDAEQISAEEPDAFEIIRSILSDTIEEISKKCTREDE